MAGGASAGGGSKAGDIRAGGAFVEISAKDSLTKTLAGLKARVMAFAGGLKVAGVGALAAGGALAAPLVGLFKGGVDRAEEISKLSEEMGFTVEQMQRLKYASDVAGVSIDQILKNPGKFKGLMDEAPLMDPVEIKAAVAAQQELRKTMISLQGAALPLIQTIYPLVKYVAEFARENRGAVISVAILSAGLLSVGAALSIVGPGVLAVVGSIVKGVMHFGLFRLSIVGAIAALLAGTDSGKAALASFSEAIRAAAATFSETWGGIVTAVKKGDLELAFKIAAAGIKSVWFGMLSDMGKAFKTWLDDNRGKLIALAALSGAIQGAMTGGRMGGPWGALGGAALGAGGAGGVAALKLNELEGLGSSPGLEAARKKADEELKKLVEQAKNQPGKAAMMLAGVDSTSGDELQRRIAAARGAFRIADAGQQFGERTNPVVRKLEVLIGLQKEAVAAIKGIKPGAIK